MKVAEDSKFNMWNTNGRRKDITDAYKIFNYTK